MADKIRHYEDKHFHAAPAAAACHSAGRIVGSARRWRIVWTVVENVIEAAAKACPSSIGARPMTPPDIERLDAIGVEDFAVTDDVEIPGGDERRDTRARRSSMRFGRSG